MAKKPRRAPFDPEIVSLVESSGSTVTYKCGHPDKTGFVFNIYGERGAPEKDILDRRERCGECLLSELQEQVIRCASCKLPILPDTPVLLGVPQNDAPRPWATFVQRPEQSAPHAIICTRRTCCTGGGLINGRWTGKEYKPYASDGTITIDALARMLGHPLFVHF